jgi:hypothetical protein
VKAQLIVGFLPQFLGHVGDFDVLMRAAFEPVENRLDGSEAVPAAQCLVEEHVDELLLDASAVLPNLRHGRAQCAYEPTAARSAARISRLTRHETAARDTAELLPLAPLFNVLFHVATSLQERSFRWFRYAALPSKDCRRALTCCNHVEI